MDLDTGPARVPEGEGGSCEVPSPMGEHRIWEA